MLLASCAQGALSAESSSADWPVIPKRAIRSNATKGEIFQLDSVPLNGRKALFLIHGGGGEKRPSFRWTNLIRALKADSEFKRRFKVYFFRYNTDERLHITTPQLKEAILQLYARCGSRPITILCLSMGGNIAQRAMLDPQVDSAVELVLSLASPFHGSPLFSPGWFQYSLDRVWYMPWARPVHNLDYLLYFSRHKTLQDDLKWDNFDELIPDVGKFKSGLGLGPVGVLSPKEDANPQLAKINTASTVNKSKFITYAGYLVNIYLMSERRQLLERSILAPVNYVTVKLPVQLGREHPALRMLNMEMSNMVINRHNEADEDSPASPHTYVLNDGITPISSALYLPPEIIKKNPMLLEHELPAISQATDVRLSRAFRNMDHISFLDGKPPKRFGSKLLIDQVHPDQESRPVFQWIIRDLLEHTRP